MQVKYKSNKLKFISINSHFGKLFYFLKQATLLKTCLYSYLIFSPIPNNLFYIILIHYKMINLSVPKDIYNKINVDLDRLKERIELFSVKLEGENQANEKKDIHKELL